MSDFKMHFKQKSGNFNMKFNTTQTVETGDYNNLSNKPSIEGNTLIGDKSFRQLGLDTLSVQEIEKILYL